MGLTTRRCDPCHREAALRGPGCWGWGVRIYFDIMRSAIIFLILAIAVGVVLPYLLQDRLLGMGITPPTLRGSTAPAREHRVSGAAVIRFFRALGVCFAAVAIFCFISFRHEP